MSLSNQQISVKNPSKKYIEFSGKIGEFTYYDKEKQEKVIIPQPFVFTVLDEMSTITGWSDEHKARIYANEVRNTREEELTVRVGKTIIAKGLYTNIKDAIITAGGKYAKSIYAYYNGEIVNIRLSGASFSAWVDKNINVSANSVKVEGHVSGKKGSVIYMIPVFVPMLMENKAEAIEADKEIQKYIQSRRTATDSTQETTPEPIIIDDLPF